jgi:hypothetical protein
MTAAKVRRVAPETGIGSLLPGATFIDAYRVTVAGEPLDASEAARRIFLHQPSWISGLMRLRDLIVRPFGLKRGDHASRMDVDRVGIFPVRSASPGRIVLGFPDKHLDFLAVVDVLAINGQSQITVTTLVQTHNLLGRAYLATILPFHRLVVRASLRSGASHVSDNLS